MVNKISPLGKKSALNRLYKEGKVVKKEGIKILFIRNEEQKIRLAYGISKKTIRKAHERNKIKRWGRYILRERFASDKAHVDMLIIITRKWDEYESFKSSLSPLVTQIQNI